MASRPDAARVHSGDVSPKLRFDPPGLGSLNKGRFIVLTSLAC